MPGDPVTLPDLKDPRQMLGGPGRKAAPRAAAPTQAAAPTRSPGSVLDGLASAWSGITDPVMREMVKTQFEVQVSRAMGLPGKINLPDPEDIEASRLQAQRANLQMQKDITVDTVNMAKAALLDLPKNDKDVVGLGLGGVDLDTLFDSDPDKGLALLQAKGFPITRSMLAIAGMKDTDTASAGPAFQQKQAEQQVGKLQTQASGVEAAGKVAKADESGVFQEQAKAALKASGEALGVDMDTVFDNPIDTDKGGVAFADAAGTLMAQAGPAFKGLVARGLLSASGSDIKDALEDEPADNGLLMVGRESGDISARATFYVTATMMRLSKETGQNIGDLFKQVGLPFTGVEPQAFNAFLGREAKATGRDPADLAAALGL